MNWAEFWIVVLRVVLTFGLLLVATVINVWAERKILADMQSRIGPNRAGPWGILQTVADGLKLFFKESITPRKVELGMYLLAPFLAVVPAFLIFMMVPWGALRRSVVTRSPSREPTSTSDFSSSSPCPRWRCMRWCSPAGRRGPSTR
jgi:NADH:ubiquinone oxidoreductase subunit H